MADPVVTLEALFGPDTAAADNSGPGSGVPGAASGTAPNGAPAGPDLAGKITELERLVGRHREQLSGSQQEILRLKTELDAVKASPSPPAAHPPPSVPSPRISLTEATKKLLLDNDDADLTAFEAQLTRQGVTREELQQILQEHDEKQGTAQRQQTARVTLQNALVQRHPQLLNDAPFIQATATRYQELTQDALTQTLYPSDPQYVFEEPGTGVKYDMRILMQAANEIKTRQPSPTPPSLGVTGGSPATPTGQTGPVVPRALVEGENAALRDPRVQAALQSLGWGANTKAQVNKLLEFVDPAVKNRWSRGEV